jgi:hypothetical protein
VKFQIFHDFPSFNGETIESAVILIISRDWMQKGIEKPLKICIQKFCWIFFGIPGNENKISHEVEALVKGIN